MQTLDPENFLYRYVPEGNILYVHESEYYEEYDFDFEDDIDEGEFDLTELNELLDKMH